MTYDGLLNRFVAMCAEVLREALVGVYLHGSAVMGCFNPEKSDLDLLVVVEGELSDPVKLAFMEQVVALNGEAPAKGLELSVLRREACNPVVHPMAFELHFSVTHLNWFRYDPEDYIRKMKGTDPDLAAHVTVLNHRGVKLYGPSIQEVFGPVAREDYIDAIWSDVENAREDIQENPMYIALNLCRVLAYLRDGMVLSKREGGEWGATAFPEYRDFLNRALRCYQTDETLVCGETGERFAAFMLDQIKMLK